MHAVDTIFKTEILWGRTITTVMVLIVNIVYKTIEHYQFWMESSPSWLT